MLEHFICYYFSQIYAEKNADFADQFKADTLSQNQCF